MNLTFDQVRSVTLGAVQLEQGGDGIRFFRFTPEQMTLVQPGVSQYKEKTLASAGIRLSFRTDSTTLYLRTLLSPGSTRSYFSFDLTVNGIHTDSMDNFTHQPIPEGDPQSPRPLGRYEKTFALGSGEKTVCLYFPWSVSPLLEEVSVDDGSFITPVIPSKKLLVYGDSISQGYDVCRPHCHHIARLARALDAQVFNKAIGGATTHPEMARAKEPFTPDYILVAYGTNDWNRGEEAFFARQYRAMLEAIRDNYPHTPVFAVTPLWRGEWKEMRPFGPFSTVEKDIRAIAADLPDVTVISGIDLVPHRPALFADLRLHPNDAGFEHYANNLWAAIRPLLKE